MSNLTKMCIFLALTLISYSALLLTHSMVAGLFEVVFGVLVLFYSFRSIREPSRRE